MSMQKEGNGGTWSDQKRGPEPRPLSYERANSRGTQRTREKRIRNAVKKLIEMLPQICKVPGPSGRTKNSGHKFGTKNPIIPQVLKRAA